MKTKTVEPTMANIQQRICKEFPQRIFSVFYSISAKHPVGCFLISYDVDLTDNELDALERLCWDLLKPTRTYELKRMPF